MLALLLACQRPSSLPSTDDSAPSGTTDTGPHEFDPETDLDWRVVEGTDGDCGTVWPLGRPIWEFNSTWGGKFSESVSWTIDPALSRTDVWDAWLVVRFRTFYTDSVGAGARWRFQCDHGSMLLLGVASGATWRTSHYKTVDGDLYAASFASPIEIGLRDTSFDVQGLVWSAHYDEYPLPVEATPATIKGSIANVGTEAIAIEDGSVDATHLVVSSDAAIFVSLFPQGLWLTEHEGLVQFQGPIGDAIAITVH